MTAEEFIDNLGGPHAVAREINKRLNTDMTGQAVSNWKRRGIPWRYRGTLVMMAQEQDLNCPDDMFGLRA